MTKKNTTCPNCKSSNVATIFYGYPADMDAYSKGVEDGTLAPGGCCVSEDDPIWWCNECSNRFGKRFTTLEEFAQ